MYDITYRKQTSNANPNAEAATVAPILDPLNATKTPPQKETPT